MGFEFKINEELAAIAVTSTELLSISRSITSLVKNKAFSQPFGDIIAEINQSYAVVNDSFAPFSALGSEASFAESFDKEHELFKGRYLLDVSKPRRYCDNVYDAYIHLQQTKEAKSNYPLLKRTMERLDVFYDKWVTNDNLLAMSIDGAVKLQNRLLNEIAELKLKDEEDAYLIFSSAFEDFREYLLLIQTNSYKVLNVIAPSKIFLKSV